jgi:hypothetical protein
MGVWAETWSLNRWDHAERSWPPSEEVKAPVGLVDEVPFTGSVQ